MADSTPALLKRSPGVKYAVFRVQATVANSGRGKERESGQKWRDVRRGVGQDLIRDQHVAVAGDA